MLHSLEALAGKISPGNGGSPPVPQSTGQPGSHVDSNANKVSHLNHNAHPYSKPTPPSLQNQTTQVTSHNNTAKTENGVNMNNNVGIGECGTVGEQPDPDFIKMFVGQVPRSMDEAELRQMFEEFGRVHQINVLRDKVTGTSKGCCFVTFFTRKAALKAQDALHNIKTLVGMHHPIQMKPADSENRNERKLFVGMLSKKMSENEVRSLFGGHGAIEECTVLRDTSGQSKGCAFVTFASKQAAIGAIKALNQSQTMEGCSAPLVVKFADTQKEKDQKRLQQMQASLWSLTGVNPSLGSSATAMTAPQHQNPAPQTSPFLAADAITPASIQLLQQLQAVGLQQHLLQGLTQGQADNTAGLLPPISVQNLVTLAAMTQPPLTAAQPSAQLTNAATSLCEYTYDNLCCLLGKTGTTGSGADTLTSAYTALPQFGSAQYAGSPLGSSALGTAAAAAAGKQIEGPEGGNLFIYHLPQEFNDTDLASTFLPFGHVVSAKVFIDKQTNLSKCFGFVSYDNSNSAQAAIQAMNGFQIGTKRLKVQLKRSKEASRPY